jgi:SAM-dependent methyltransferase
MPHNPAMTLHSTERFSSRVDNYVKYRPSYPREVFELLRQRCGLGTDARVADIGSGTGILTSRLLESGAEVFAVEPNRAMREAAERQLARIPRFHSVAGTAEATTLEPRSVDLVVAAQAFHWFDPARSRAELTRILEPSGSAALIWNERPPEATPFFAEYEALVRRHCAEYDQVTATRTSRAGAMREYFGCDPERAVFAHRQVFDFEGLKGRLMSSSYAPEPGHPEHEPLMAGLEELFGRHHCGGSVVFPYRTLVYFGRVAPLAG